MVGSQKAGMVPQGDRIKWWEKEEENTVEFQDGQEIFCDKKWLILRVAYQCDKLEFM